MQEDESTTAMYIQHVLSLCHGVGGGREGEEGGKEGGEAEEHGRHKTHF